MRFKPSVISALYQYATFTGRASRSEFWYFILFCFLCGCVAGIVDLILFGEKTVSDAGTFYSAPQRIGWVPVVLFFLPNLAVSTRRLHDVNMSGWWICTCYLPIILSILLNIPILGLIGLIANVALIVLFCKKGTDGDNHYGYPPLIYQ